MSSFLCITYIWQNSVFYFPCYFAVFVSPDSTLLGSTEDNDQLSIIALMMAVSQSVGFWQCVVKKSNSLSIKINNNRLEGQISQTVRGLLTSRVLFYLLAFSCPYCCHRSLCRSSLKNMSQNNTLLWKSKYLCSHCKNGT